MEVNNRTQAYKEGVDRQHTESKTYIQNKQKTDRRTRADRTTEQSQKEITIKGRQTNKQKEDKTKEVNTNRQTERTAEMWTETRKTYRMT